MTRIFKQRRVLKIVPGLLLVLTMVLANAITPSARASNQAAASTSTAISDQLSGQIDGMALTGWVSGTQDSTGIITATLTMADATTNAPVTENVSGRMVGSGSSAMVMLAVTPMVGAKGSAWVMAGGATSKTAGWAGTVTRGQTYVGSWALTPRTSTFNINFGGKAGSTSKDNVSVSGSINAGVTAAGWASGTYTSFDGTVSSVVRGWVNTGGDFSFTIPWGKAGTVVLMGLQGKQKLGHPSWSGNFIGPGVGDTGTWVGQS